MKQATGPVIELRGHKVEERVVNGIRAASRRTGVDFAYLMAQAERESAFRPEAQRSGSSAAGLFQFTAQTWLAMLDRHGASYGRGDLAAAITKDAKGIYSIADPARRKEILALRRDPELSAAMAAEYAKANQTRLAQALGRPVEAADLFLAHFVGPNGATRLLKAREATPERAAAEVVPQAARGNRRYFYDPASQAPRSVAAVYRKVQEAMERPMSQYAALERPTPPAPAAPVAEAGALPAFTLAAEASAAAALIPTREPPPVAEAMPVVAGDDAVTRFFRGVRRQIFGQDT